MVLALLVLATPYIGPPPNVGPLKPEPELEVPLEFEEDNPDEFEVPPAADELPKDEPPEAEFPASPLAEVCVPEPACCPEPIWLPKLLGLPPKPPCPPPNPPCPPAPLCPGVCPNTGPLFKLMSC